jgi:ferritin-like metal-binding protein YciE
MGQIILDEARTFYITGLHNAHAMETQAIQLLTRQIERLENYPEI